MLLLHCGKGKKGADAGKGERLPLPFWDPEIKLKGDTDYMIN